MTRLIACLIALLLPAVAIAEAYDCTTTNFGRGGWVSKRIVLNYDAAAGTATAIDAGINQIHKKPIPVEFEQRSDTSYIFRWTINGLKASNGGKGANTYKVTLFTKRNAFTLSGRRHGYDNVISGEGTCKRLR